MGAILTSFEWLLSIWALRELKPNMIDLFAMAGCLALIYKFMSCAGLLEKQRKADKLSVALNAYY